MSTIRIVLPDNSEKEFDHEPSVLEVAESIGSRLAKDTVYMVTSLATTNYDAILERVFDGAMLEDPLRIHQPGGFEPVVDISHWSELQGEEEGQPEVAVELEVSFPPKSRRTVVGTVGARFRAPFETAFSAELAELDGA